jgi:hypothetical protein
VLDLRPVYEAVKGRTYDPKTFHRKFRRMLADEILVVATGKRTTGANRPSTVYHFKR